MGLVSYSKPPYAAHCLPKNIETTSLNFTPIPAMSMDVAGMLSSPSGVGALLRFRRWRQRNENVSLTFPLASMRISCMLNLALSSSPLPWFTSKLLFRFNNRWKLSCFFSIFVTFSNSDCSPAEASLSCCALAVIAPHSIIAINILFFIISRILIANLHKKPIFIIVLTIIMPENQPNNTQKTSPTRGRNIFHVWEKNSIIVY